MRLVRVVVLGFMLHALATPLANADPIFLPEPSPLNYIPTEQTLSEAEIIAHALSMPAVQQAVNIFNQRGYIRDTSTDRGGQNGAKSLVALGYTIPGYPHVGGVITVATETNGGVPFTRVIAGLYEINAETGEPVASGLMNSPNNDAFEISIEDMSNTNQSNYMFRGQKIADIMEFLVCTITVCQGCGAACRFVFMPPAITTCFTVCCLVGAVGCIIAAF